MKNKVTQCQIINKHLELHLTVVTQLVFKENVSPSCCPPTSGVKKASLGGHNDCRTIFFTFTCANIVYTCSNKRFPNRNAKTFT